MAERGTCSVAVELIVACTCVVAAVVLFVFVVRTSAVVVVLADMADRVCGCCTVVAHAAVVVMGPFLSVSASFPARLPSFAAPPPRSWSPRPPPWAPPRLSYIDEIFCPSAVRQSPPFLTDLVSCSFS